ncbi:hypothetical protein ACJRO7_013858 [Eucalyptus globulus]|uniref:Uncharacterized protein n=1 Tax=Eucalyptus globulus TaxID=34317 RepID=A0ABD3KZ70_EUCGL
MATLDSDVPMVPAGEGTSSGAAASSSSSSSSKKPKRFEIKKWNAIALWGKFPVERKQKRKPLSEPIMILPRSLERSERPRFFFGPSSNFQFG